MTEIQTKLELVREAMERANLGAVRLRGVDWFAWATGGGNSVVMMANETGVGEVLITRKQALVLTNPIEAQRFHDEEVPEDLRIFSAPWQEAEATERFILQEVGDRPVASDRPRGEERALPDAVVRAKRRLLPDEMARYRQLGRETAEAITETLQAATPEMTEFELAGLGARAMFARGIHPTLVLASGEKRSEIYRHPFPSTTRLGERAMLVFCGRRHGLYANLTRFVSFRPPTGSERARLDAVMKVENTAWDTCVPGTKLSEVYQRLATAYREVGFEREINYHHQGGTTGYLSREVIANPHTHEIIDECTAFAWNPSVPGMKVEDTMVRGAQGIEILTVDPRWPTRQVAGQARPEILVRA